jgi:hypothetical protein
VLTWLRKWRERAAKAQAEADQKRWDAEQARRRESLASQRAWHELQEVQNRQGIEIVERQ